MFRCATIVAVFWLCAEGRPGTGQEAARPALPPDEAALAKVQGLRANQAVLLGKAQVVGEFNDVARKYNLHQTGPMGRDFTIKMAWVPEPGPAAASMQRSRQGRLLSGRPPLPACQGAMQGLPRPSAQAAPVCRRFLVDPVRRPPSMRGHFGTTMVVRFVPPLYHLASTPIELLHDGPVFVTRRVRGAAGTSR